MKKPLLYLLILLVTVFSTSCSQSSKETFEIGDKTFLLNGKPFVVKAAEIHYPRIPKEYWEHRIKMCKALGMNTICLYVFWNFHEPEEGKYDFTGQKDIAAFCRLAQENGMYVIVRPGPYVCAEWEMGGLPWWLLKKKDIKLREQDPYYMEWVKLFILNLYHNDITTFTNLKISKQVSQEFLYSNVTGIRTLRIMHWMICFGQSTLVQGLILTINLSVCKNSVLIFR